jgi:multidrug efflux pump subunit AcrB
MQQFFTPCRDQFGIRRTSIARVLFERRSQSARSCTVRVNRWRCAAGHYLCRRGANIAQNIEGRERFPINVRYERDFRGDPEALGRVLVGTPSGAQIPISEIARLSFSRGPAMIRDEDGALTGYVYLDLKTKDYGGFVDQADKLLRNKLDLPAGYTYR